MGLKVLHDLEGLGFLEVNAEALRGIAVFKCDHATLESIELHHSGPAVEGTKQTAGAKIPYLCDGVCTGAAETQNVPFDCHLTVANSDNFLARDLPQDPIGIQPAERYPD